MEQITPTLEITTSPSGKTKYFNVRLSSGSLIQCRTKKAALLLIRELISGIQQYISKEQSIHSSESGKHNESSEYISNGIGDNGRPIHSETFEGERGFEAIFEEFRRATTERFEECRRATTERFEEFGRATTERFEEFGRGIQEALQIAESMDKTLTQFAALWDASKTNRSTGVSGIQRNGYRLEESTINVTSVHLTDDFSDIDCPPTAQRWNTTKIKYS